VEGLHLEMQELKDSNEGLINEIEDLRKDLYNE
jgi:cell division protein FtsB